MSINKSERKQDEFNTVLNMSINKSERKQDEFNTVLNVLSRYSPRNKKYSKAKNELLDNATYFYKGREGIIEGFKNGIFLLIKKDFHSDGQRPDLPATSDSSIDESHCLTDKELQMFEKLFSCKNPEELEQALMRADTEEKYNEFLNDLNIKETVLTDQIKTKIGVSCTRLRNLVNVVKNILDRVRLQDNIPELEIKESGEQEGQGRGLEILTPNQMLNRLPITLA